jgi:hypothetical protein
MAEQRKTAANAPIRCACGREELLTPAIPQPGNLGGEKQPAEDERPGSQSGEMAVTAGPVMAQSRED